MEDESLFFSKLLDPNSRNADESGLPVRLDSLRASDGEAHPAQHHHHTVGVQEARGVPVVEAHLRLHRCPGTAAELLFLRLRAGTLQGKDLLSELKNK